MNLFTTKYFLAILFLLFEVTGTFVKAQNIQDGVFFSDEEIKPSEQSNSNISFFKKDEVRAGVFKLAGRNEPYRIKNNQDTALSFACWLRPQNIDVNSGTIFGKHKSFYFRYLSNRKIQFNHYLQNDVYTGAFISENQWQHLGFTLNNKGQLNIFLNGQQVASDSISSNWWEKEGDYVLGSDLYEISSEGFIDEIKVWNRELTENEIAEVYLQTLLLPEFENGLLLYCPLQEDFIDLVDKKRDIQINGNITFNENVNSHKGAYFGKDFPSLLFSNFLFDTQQTITLWIKPEQLKSPQALVGNSNFVLRYLPLTNQLWYSVPMQFGLQSKKTEAINGEWIHVAVSVSFNNKIDFFINGKLVDSQPIQDKTGNENLIVLGRSIWGNTFQGFMANLAVWDRALTASEIKEVYLGKLDTLSFKQKENYSFIYLIILLAVFVSVYFIFFKKKKNSKRLQSEDKFELPQKNAIYFFDTFKAFNHDGVDISSDFAPTLLRVFVLVLIYPKVYGRCISSTVLSSILWPNDNAAQQKNNRNANIYKLRTVFKNFEGLLLQFENKEWKVTVPGNLFIDLENHERIISDSTIEIPFASIDIDKNVDAQGVEKVIQLYNDKRMQFLNEECKKNILTSNLHRVLVLSKLWLSIDGLSDEALKFGIDALMKLGRRESALRFYDSFARNYLSLLNEEYPKSFKELM